MSKHYVGDIGTEILADLGENVTSVPDLLQIKFKKPGGAEGFWSASLYENRYARYIVQSGDWDVAGGWQGQAYIEVDGGNWHGDTFNWDLKDLWE